MICESKMTLSILFLEKILRDGLVK